jgi:hypothetical protein
MKAVGVPALAALMVAACGVSPGADPATTTTLVATTTTSTTTPPPPDVIRVGDLGIVALPDANGSYPDDLPVTCGSGVFPIGALDNILPLEDADPGGVAAAIEPFLEGEEGEFWPQDGWQILYETEDRIHLIAMTDMGTLAHMHVTFGGSGWTWAGASLAGDPCELQFVVPEELNTVDWRLDPEGEPLSASTVEIGVILTERPCVDGREIGDRLLGPEIVMTETRVFIAFAAERPEGDAFTCPGNPDTPYVVELPEPLGDRELMEGLRIGITLEDYLD